MKKIMKNKNITYFSESGCYEVDNVGFGVVVIEDVSAKGSRTGMVEKLPKFPNKFSKKVTTKISLFHGTVNTCKMNEDYKATAGVPVDWIQGYDIRMYGDIHLMQIHEAEKIEKNKYKYIKGKAWGYSSSLIQQDKGESVYGHGYLKWNIVEESVEFVHIRNDYGYLKVEKMNYPQLHA